MFHSNKKDLNIISLFIKIKYVNKRVRVDLFYDQKYNNDRYINVLYGSKTSPYSNKTKSVDRISTHKNSNLYSEYVDLIHKR